MYWNLFLSIIYILATLFLLSSGYRLLSTNSLIRLALFNKVFKKSFISFFRVDTNVNSLRFFITKPSSISVVLTNSKFDLGLPTIAYWQFYYWSLLIV